MSPMVMVAHKDRMVRFGFEWPLEVLLVSWNQNPRHEWASPSLPQEKMFKDLFLILRCFPKPSLRLGPIQKKRPEGNRKRR
ncbi:hypothetical protein A7K73_08900 [Candidatus Methylacidiphilum fumarolicum]|nr:hypothetical protein A7K73_08900 [Candidatus Methylacidiphilum fumarolicum]TFE77689.1 hypothetical protein A7D33_03440 [Candidatus Methylacidiphilum fumarolicum]